MNTNTNEVTLEAVVAIAPEVVLPKSVVAVSYKRKYAEQALAGNKKYRKEISKKARARMTGDWLAQELATRTLDDKDHLLVDVFLSILSANGVDHSRWTNRSKGWEGRLRMTGRLALQRAVAAEEQLFLPDGTTVTPPASWVAKFQN